MSTVTGTHPPLLRAADFQSAWYYSMVVFAMLLAAVWAAAVVMRAVPGMWRAEQRGMAVLVTAVTTVTMLLFTSMLLAAAIGLLRGSLQ